jgi:hypothetical protein
MHELLQQLECHIELKSDKTLIFTLLTRGLDISPGLGLRGCFDIGVISVEGGRFIFIPEKNNITFRF